MSSLPFMDWQVQEVAWFALIRDQNGQMPAYYRSDNALIWMFDYIKGVREDLDLSRFSHLLFEKADIKQQVAFLYIQAEKVYEERKPNVSRKSYIIRRVAWGVRDYLVKQSQIVHQYPYYYFIEEKPEFVLDLQFLAYGTKVYPLSELSPYERYLIFLHYKEEKSILEISKMVHHKWDTVKLRFDAALNKLRRLSNEQT